MHELLHRGLSDIDEDRPERQSITIRTALEAQEDLRLFSNQTNKSKGNH